MLGQDLMSFGNQIKKKFPAPIRKVLVLLIRPLSQHLERRQLHRLYANFVSPGDLAFDVGAHAGTMTAVLLRHGARVVCVDPQPSCIRILESRFGGRPDVTLEPVGISDAEGTLAFSICEKPQSSTFAEQSVKEWAPGVLWQETITVPVTTLEHLIAKHGAPRFCKIDVEGFEVKVLGGLKRALPFLSFEFHGEELDLARRCVERILELGPTDFQISLFTRHRLHFPDWVSAETLFEFLENRRGPVFYGDIYARSLSAEPVTAARSV